MSLNNQSNTGDLNPSNQQYRDNSSNSTNDSPLPPLETTNVNPNQGSHTSPIHPNIPSHGPPIRTGAVHFLEREPIMPPYQGGQQGKSVKIKPIDKDLFFDGTKMPMDKFIKRYGIAGMCQPQSPCHST